MKAQIGCGRKALPIGREFWSLSCSLVRSTEKPLIDRKIRLVPLGLRVELGGALLARSVRVHNVVAPACP